MPRRNTREKCYCHRNALFQMLQKAIYRRVQKVTMVTLSDDIDLYLGNDFDMIDFRNDETTKLCSKTNLYSMERRRNLIRILQPHAPIHFLYNTLAFTQGITCRFGRRTTRQKQISLLLFFYSNPIPTGEPALTHIRHLCFFLSEIYLYYNHYERISTEV